MPDEPRQVQSCADRATGVCGNCTDCVPVEEWERREAAREQAPAWPVCPEHGTAECERTEADPERTPSPPLGVSCIVRISDDMSSPDLAGRLGMVIGQAANGPNRYSVMVPGDPFTYSLSASSLDVVQGVDLDGWWRR